MTIDREARALLAEALLFFNDRPNFGLRREHRRTSYDLASRISTYLAPEEPPPHPAIAVARERWRMTDFLRIDDDERIVERSDDGYWVRGWIHIAFASVGEIDPALAARYAEAVARLPAITREVLLAHQRDGLGYRAVGERLGITVTEVEQHIAEALLLIGRALGRL